MQCGLLALCLQLPSFHLLSLACRCPLSHSAGLSLLSALCSALHPFVDSLGCLSGWRDGRRQTLRGGRASPAQNHSLFPSWVPDFALSPHPTPRAARLGHLAKIIDSQAPEFQAWGCLGIAFRLPCKGWDRHEHPTMRKEPLHPLFFPAGTPPSDPTLLQGHRAGLEPHLLSFPDRPALILLRFNHICWCSRCCNHR